MKKLLFICFLLATSAVSAQNLFWAFNDDQQPMTIAPECDARFDEVRGGVFVPTTEEVYQYGTIFLENQSYEIKRQAPYCFLVAALNGNADAQFKLAQLYNQGDILPQDDLSAYKWAFIAALNGNKEAEKFTLSLEQFLTTEDLQATGAAIQDMRLQIQENQQKQMAALASSSDTGRTAPKGTTLPRQTGKAPIPTSLSQIFSQKDHFQ